MNTRLSAREITQHLDQAHAVVTARPVAGEPGELIDAIGSVRRLQRSLAAIEAALCAQFDTERRAQHRATGMKKQDVGRGVTLELALARGVSPARAGNDLALQRDLLTTAPKTYALLADGVIDPQAAFAVVQESFGMDTAERIAIDHHLAEDLPAMSVKQSRAAAHSEAARRDPAALVARHSRAVKSRRVSTRPAPDGMVYLSALVPLSQGIAAWACLRRDAKAMHAAGDERSCGQIEADLLIERVTGQATAQAIPIEIQVVITAETLLGDSDEPARVGPGIIPAEVARDLALHPDRAAAAAIRRLFTDPCTGNLIAVDKARRLFTGELRRYIQTRDQTCSTPGCDAPISHLDHATAYRLGGATDAVNGRGVCVRCNHAKETPGFIVTASQDGTSHTVQITTPTGHTYHSKAPPVLGRPPDHESALEAAFLNEHGPPNPFATKRPRPDTTYPRKRLAYAG